MRPGARCLVTGGHGFIGSALVRRLVRDGYSVRVFDNESRGSSVRLADLTGIIEVVRDDIRDAAAVRRATAGMDTVFHLAAVNGTHFFYSRPDGVLEVGVAGLVNVLNACRAEETGELIFASSSEVYGQPNRIPTDETAPLVVPDLWNPRYSYSSSKIIGEMMVMHVGRTFLERAIVFRPHNVYGPDMGWEHVIPQLALRLHRLCVQSPDGPVVLPIQGTGQESRAFIYIDDFIDALMLVALRGPHPSLYNIGTEEETTVAELARLMGGILGRSVVVEPGELARGSPLRRCPDVSKLAQLGFRPAHNLKDGLTTTLKWYIDNFRKAPPDSSAPLPRGGTCPTT